MRFKVYLPRHHGRRLAVARREERQDFTGTLVTREFRPHNKERYVVLDLEPNPEAGAFECLPPLYEPVLLGFAPLAFRLRGFERVGQGDDAFSVVQEWHVEER